MREGKPKYVHRLGEEFLESNPTEKDLRVLVNKKLSISQQHALAAWKTSGVLVFFHQKRNGLQDKGGDSSPPLCPSEGIIIIIIRAYSI